MRSSEFQTHILGSDVHYWIYHEDKPHTMLMIHGFRGNHHGLHDLVAMLPTYRIIVPDLPGFGESTPLASSHHHDIAGYTAFVEDFVRRLGLEHPSLLGHSFGSIIAASVAARSPQLIDKLVLINAIASPALKGPRTFFNQGAKLYYKLGAALPERAGRALLSSKAVVQATSSLLAKTKDKQLRADIHRHHHKHFTSFQTREALLEAFDASVRHTVADYAADIAMPTLLIAGAIDDIAPLKGQYILEQLLPDAELVIIEAVGHLIHREAPKQAAEAIIHFLSQ